MDFYKTAFGASEVYSLGGPQRGGHARRDAHRRQPLHAGGRGPREGEQEPGHPGGIPRQPHDLRGRLRRSVRARGQGRRDGGPPRADALLRGPLGDRGRPVRAQVGHLDPRGGRGPRGGQAPHDGDLPARGEVERPCR